MALQAQYASVPKVGIANILTANAARDGTGAVTTIITGGTNGTRIDRISVEATGTTTAGMVRFFVSDTTAANTAANTHLWNETIVTAVTPTANTKAFSSTLSSPLNPDTMPLFLPAGYTLRVATNNAENFRVLAIGGDY